MSAISRRTFASLLLLLLALSGCAGNRTNLWPIYYQESRPAAAPGGVERVTTREVLWPFFAMETEPGRHYHAVRPLYNYEVNAEKGTVRLQYLWPFGLHFEREGDRWEHRLWPLFDHSVRWLPATGEKAVSGFLFPLVWWGRRPPQGNYFALFPVGGVLRGILGDSFTFVLFPLFSAYRKDDYRRYDVLWPIFSSGRSSDGRRRTARAWPLYVHHYKEGRYDRYYVLWPFFRWGAENMEGKYPQKHFQFFPLFAWKTAIGPDGNVVAYHWQVLLVSRRKDTRPRFALSVWSFLWWLVRFATAPKSDETRIFPFYWRTTWYADRSKDPQRSWARHRILWPFIWLDFNRMDRSVEERNVIVAPFYWDYRKRYRDGEEGERARSITLWPLFTWQSDRDGAVHFWVLSHGWKDAPEGFKRNYRPFFDLFQYHSRSDGERETRLLWRLYHRKRGPKGSYLNLLGLFTYESSLEEETVRERTVSLLFGLIQCRYRDGGSGWRIFYVPVGG